MQLLPRLFSWQVLHLLQIRRSLTFMTVAQILCWNRCTIPWKGVCFVSSCSMDILTRIFSFFNGGLLFSIVTFTFIALISLYSFLLLVKTKFVVSGSFGGTNSLFLYNTMATECLHLYQISVEHCMVLGCDILFSDLSWFPK